MPRRRDFDDDETNEFFEKEDDFDDFDDVDFGDDEDDETVDEEDNYSGDSAEKTVESGKKRKAEILGFIVVKKGRRKNDKYDLTQNDIIIGRSNKCCDIVMDDEDISKIHCRIRRDPEKNEFHFFDCGSTNGTMINNEEVHTKILKSHDVITLGEGVEIVFIQV